MNLRYMNHKGEILDLSKPPFFLQTTNIFDFEWSYDISDRGNRRSSVTRFYRTSKSPTATLVVLGKTDKEFKDNMVHFFNVTEADIVENTPGKLLRQRPEGMVDDSETPYLECYLVSTSNNISPYMKANTREITILSPNPFWITEKKRKFFLEKQQEVAFSYKKTEDETIKDKEYFTRSGTAPDYIYTKVENPVASELPNYYERVVDTIKQYSYDAVNREDVMYDYDFDYYKSSGTNGTLDNDAVDSSEFIIHIDGPCTNPKIVIGDNEYLINIDVSNGEKLYINSIEKTVTLYDVVGNTTNAFQYRGTNGYIFERIAAGINDVSWDGTFQWDITLYQQRSEPKWNI